MEESVGKEDTRLSSRLEESVNAVCIRKFDSAIRVIRESVSQRLAWLAGWLVIEAGVGNANSTQVREKVRGFELGILVVEYRR